MKATWLAAAGLCLGLAIPAEAQRRGNSSIRFQEMDLNGDAVITREEWRGNDRSFRNQDWNGDGKLSGDEVRVGARRANREADVQPPVDPEDDWTRERFVALDLNGDGRLSTSEWRVTAAMFSRVDQNRDNFISRAEFTGEPDDNRDDRFADLDTNNDGRLTRSEWRGSAAVFDALDANRDAVLTRAEAIGTEGGARDEFRSVDVNGDGSIDRAEWHWNAAAFDRLDANRDGRLTPPEFNSSTAVALPAVPMQTAAYRAGYERGQQEGVQAGREDKPRGWDLEGQRELETADSGYEARIGDRAEYQAGYRNGFRRGYREGFGPRHMNP